MADTRSPAQPAAEMSERDLADLAGASILLVDDNLQNLELMQAYLEGLRCNVRTARDGVEAVRMIDEDAPDLVLLDVMMPRMSGFEVCHRIKSTPATSSIMVIMVTALHEVGDFERAKEAGTDDFITKPVNKLELLTRVESLLRFALLKREYDRLLQLTRRGGLDDTGDLPAVSER
jgi:two-component system alkaline phosphatase synthesis response regulator PhoP